MQPQLPTVRNQWIYFYIKQNHPQQTRYEIDYYLINNGADPSEIEMVWHDIAVEKKAVTPHLNRHSLDFGQFMSKYLPLIVCLILFLISLPFLIRPSQLYWFLFFSQDVALIFAIGNFFIFLLIFIFYKSYNTFNELSTFVRVTICISGIFATLFFLNPKFDGRYSHIDSADLNGHKYHLTYQLCDGRWGCSYLSWLFECEPSGFFCEKLGTIYPDKENWRQLRNFRLSSNPETGKLSMLYNNEIVRTFDPKTDVRKEE
jgi:hypothetical protein